MNELRFLLSLLTSLTEPCLGKICHVQTAQAQPFTYAVGSSIFILALHFLLQSVTTSYFWSELVISFFDRNVHINGFHVLGKLPVLWCFTNLDSAARA